MRSTSLFSLILLFILGSPALAQSQRGYNLFNPTPREQMREFAIDRPDITESPITVDAGHFQFEGDMIKWSRDNGTNSSGSAVTFVNALYKMGLTHSWDIHIGIEPYTKIYTPENEIANRGYGATTIRLKHNFWGNDGGTKTALGIIPYVSFVNGNPFDSDVVFGAGFPYEYELSSRFSLGGQSQFDFIPDVEKKGSYNMSYFQTIVLGGAVIGNLDFFAESVAIFPPGSNAQFLLDGGLIYNFSPNIKVDIATNIGLNNYSPTRVFLGLSFRI